MIGVSAWVSAPGCQPIGHGLSAGGPDGNRNSASEPLVLWSPGRSPPDSGPEVMVIPPAHPRGVRFYQAMPILPRSELSAPLDYWLSTTWS
jgi:hypothetical protein